jgi:hypothetical protein
MDDYKKIYDAYRLVNEASFSYAGNYSDSTEQPKRQLARFKTPKPDYKNSSAINTASLPGGTRQVNVAAMGTGGGIEQGEETVHVKGFGDMTKKELHNLYDKVMKEVHTLKSKGHYSQLSSKLDLLNTLAKQM